MYPKLTVILQGGLGNQLYQYNYAKFLSKKLGVDLQVEDRFGFIIDFKYKRKCVIKDLITYRRLNLLQSLLIFLNLAALKVFGRPFNKTILLKKEVIDHEKLLQYKNVVLIGYFQTHEIDESIIQEIIYRGDVRAHKRFNKTAILIRTYSEVTSAIERSERNKNLKNYINIIDEITENTLNFEIHTVDPRLKSKYGNRVAQNSNEVDMIRQILSCDTLIYNNSTLYTWIAAIAKYSGINKIHKFK